MTGPSGASSAATSGPPAAVKALTDGEREHPLAVLTSDRLMEQVRRPGVGEVAGRGRLPVLQSTMRRILHGNHAAGERRCQATHPPRTIPELLATRSGPVWSRDITKLKGPARWAYYLYSIIDIYMRDTVG